MKKILCLIAILGLLAAGPIAIADSDYLFAKKDKVKKQKNEHDPGVTIVEDQKGKKSKGKKKGADSKDCHHQCRDEHSEGVQACIDSGTKPLSACIKKVNQDKKDCLRACSGKESKKK